MKSATTDATMIRLFGFFLIALGITFHAVTPASAESRFALVIGNSNYTVGPLANPVNDADLMAEALKSVGFDVTLHKDLEHYEFGTVITDFGTKLANAGDDAVGLFFYAGHAIQANGENYLIPTTAVLQSQADLDFRTIRLSTVLRAMRQNEKQLNIVFLDACRNNPFEALTRSTGSGLGAVDKAAGTFVSYATAPGTVAVDGTSRNSPYTKALARYIREPGLLLEQVLRRVRTDVLERTGNRQRPWDQSSIEGDFYFVPASVTNEETVVDTNPEEGFRVSETDIIQFATQQISIRSGPGNTFERVGKVLPGEEVIVTGMVEGMKWVRIEGKDGGEAYVYGPLLQDEDPISNAWEVASSTDSVEGYQAFLRAYPLSPQSEEARTRVETLTEPTSDDGSRDQVAVGLSFDPGSRFRDCQDCPEMIVVPPGKFDMGSHAGDPDHTGDETPVISVEFFNSFAIGLHEVTFDEWAACVAGGGCDGYTPHDAGWGGGGLPVVNVGWQDIQSYVAWLNDKTGKTYRLPSEAEWEYAARAGSTTRFWSGDNPEDLAGVANCADCGEDSEFTAPVGSHGPNDFGLHDMHGNVAEWVQDCYQDNHVGASAEGAARVVEDCQDFVIRGGSWLSDPIGLRSANRAKGSGSARFNTIGFRLLREIPAG